MKLIENLTTKNSLNVMTWQIHKKVSRISVIFIVMEVENEVELLNMKIKCFSILFFSYNSLIFEEI